MDAGNKMKLRMGGSDAAERQGLDPADRTKSWTCRIRREHADYALVSIEMHPAIGTSLDFLIFRSLVTSGTLWATLVAEMI